MSLLFQPTFKITSNLDHHHCHHLVSPFEFFFFWYAAFSGKSALAFDNELHNHFLNHFLNHSTKVNLLVPIFFCSPPPEFFLCVPTPEVFFSTHYTKLSLHTPPTLFSAESLIFLFLVVAPTPIAVFDFLFQPIVHIPVHFHAYFLVPDQFSVACLAQFDKPTLFIFSVTPPAILIPALSFVF